MMFADLRIQSFFTYFATAMDRLLPLADGLSLAAVWLSSLCLLLLLCARAMRGGLSGLLADN